MKTTTFESAKVGDKVWDIRRGWGVIYDNSVSDEYPITVQFPNGSLKIYTVDGLYHKNDLTRSLFWNEVKIDPPSKPLPDLAKDTKVLVWNSIVPKTKRHFSHFNESGKIMCFDHGKTSWTTEQTSEWGNWELAE